MKEFCNEMKGLGENERKIKAGKKRRWYMKKFHRNFLFSF